MTASRTLPFSSVNVAAQTRSMRDIVLAHGKYVWRLLRYLGVAESDLDDVFQEVFTTVHQKLDELKDDGLRPWLHTMCVYHAKNHRRRAHYRREALMETPPESVAPAPQEDSLEVARRQRRLLSLLDQLDQDKRTIFILHAVEEVPMDQVAKIVGCSVSTSYQRFRQVCIELEKGVVGE